MTQSSGAPKGRSSPNGRGRATKQRTASATRQPATKPTASSGARQASSNGAATHNGSGMKGAVVPIISAAIGATAGVVGAAVLPDAGPPLDARANNDKEE